MSDKEVLTEDQYTEQLEHEIGAWEHKVRQLTNEREGLLELNRLLETDRRNLIDRVASLESKLLELLAKEGEDLLKEATDA